MPRITKADLTATLDASLRRVEILEQELHAKQTQNVAMSVALLSADARVALLEKENKALKAERGQGARSRSPRRDAMSAATTHRALNSAEVSENRGCGVFGNPVKSDGDCWFV